MGLVRNTNGTVGDPGPPSDDRRRIIRHSVVLPDALLGWWEQENYTTISVQLVNLSISGCMVESRQLVGRAERQPVWMRALAVEPAEWTEAVVVRVKKPLFRRCQVRLRFLAPFPFESFKMLVYGPDQGGVSETEETPEHERDKFWR